MTAASYAGAVAAIGAKFAAEWITAPDTPRTRIALVNENPEAPWPPRDTDNALVPWVRLSVEGAGADIATFGLPGSNFYLYEGLIYVHVFVPVGDGVSDAFDLAVIAGDIFRAQRFYDTVSDGCCVRSRSPRVDGGAPGDDDGVWFCVTATIPFEYWHRA